MNININAQMTADANLTILVFSEGTVQVKLIKKSIAKLPICCNGVLAITYSFDVNPIDVKSVDSAM